MPQNLSTSIIPSQESTIDYPFATLSIKFGNGYSQDLPDGINNNLEMLNMIYTDISVADYTTIINTLKAAGGWDKIIYTYPGKTEKKYKLEPKSLKESRRTNTYTLRFTLRQVP